MPADRQVRARELERKVAELRDRNPKRWSWRRIAKKLGISHVGAVKAYRRHQVNRHRSLPRDDPGPDVAERLRAVYITVAIAYHVPNAKTRTRNGVPDQPREDIAMERTIQTVMTEDAMHPLRGPALMANHVGQLVYKRLTYEGWPLQVRKVE
jgi:hypothetical protein